MTHARTLRGALVAGALSAICALTADSAAPTAQPFPAADPESVGIPARALKLLAGRAQAMVDREEIVGGELLVIKNRRMVFREAYGWKDREARRPMEVDAIYCVRSMTKPLVGTAIQLLIDEGRLGLDTPVHEILPFFAGPRTGTITIAHLLTHTGGFPLTTIRRSLTEYADLAAVAAEAAEVELLFAPGSRFEYSDASSDTLGAVVAKIAGMPVEQFIRQRILDPLTMADTRLLLGDDDAALKRIPSAYSGGTGAWAKHWEPSGGPLFPLFLASQGLYATTTDYARFLVLWMDGGKAGDRRLLSPEAVTRALAPNRRMAEAPRGPGGLDVYYGQHWVVYARAVDGGRPEAIVFGHSGSDGTHAWAWPEQDLIVLFFTQSRGTLAGVGLEGVLDTLLVAQALDDPSLARRVASAEELEQVAGLYWDETNAGAYYVIAPRGQGLTLERPGRAHLVFRPGDSPGRFVHEVDAGAWIEFLRSEQGKVTAMRTSFGGRVETDPRHVPAAGLPSVEEVVALVKQAHRVDRLSGLGVVRMSGTLTFETRKIEGSLTTLFDAARTRLEIRAGPIEELTVLNDGNAWTRAALTGTEELDGSRREQVLLDRPGVRFGDWTEHYEHVEVLKRVQAGDDSALLVRVVPREAPGATMFVHEPSGRVGRVDSLAHVPGVGIVGVQTRYTDFRDVGGMQLPFRSVARFATPLIGSVVMTWSDVETGVEVAESTFAPPTGSEEHAR